MATFSLAAIAPTQVRGKGNQVLQAYDFDAKLANGGVLAAGDVILTPVFQVPDAAVWAMVKKISALANADVLTIEESADAAFTAGRFSKLGMSPLGASGGDLSVATAAAHVWARGYPVLPYLRGSITLTTSVPATLRLILAFGLSEV